MYVYSVHTAQVRTILKLLRSRVAGRTLSFQDSNIRKRVHQILSYCGSRILEQETIQEVRIFLVLWAF